MDSLLVRPARFAALTLAMVAALGVELPRQMHGGAPLLPRQSSARMPAPAMMSFALMSPALLTGTPGVTFAPAHLEVAMDTQQTFEDFRTQSLGEGFDEVLVREWAPDQVVAEHTHPFAVQARVVRGEVWLGCEGQTRHIAAGGGFELACNVPHTERYGVEGATFWVARRHAS